MPYAEVEPDEVKARIAHGEDVFLLDVREPDEVEAWAYPIGVNIPLGQLGDRLDEVPRDVTVVVACHGRRPLRHGGAGAERRRLDGREPHGRRRRLGGRGARRLSSGPPWGGDGGGGGGEVGGGPGRLLARHGDGEDNRVRERTHVVRARHGHRTGEIETRGEPLFLSVQVPVPVAVVIFTSHSFRRPP